MLTNIGLSGAGQPMSVVMRPSPPLTEGTPHQGEGFNLEEFVSLFPQELDTVSLSVNNPPSQLQAEQGTWLDRWVEILHCGLPSGESTAEIGSQRSSSEAPIPLTVTGSVPVSSEEAHSAESSSRKRARLDETASGNRLLPVSLDHAALADGQRKKILRRTFVEEYLANKRAGKQEIRRRYEIAAQYGIAPSTVTQWSKLAETHWQQELATQAATPASAVDVTNTNPFQI